MSKRVDKLPNDDIAGILTLEELKGIPGYPKEEDFNKGLIVVVECDEDIPCNPCENICGNCAITIGTPITNLPKMNADICDGCLRCIGVCPGLCIFGIKKHYNEKQSLIYIPYEYEPLPEKGLDVDALDRYGEFVCKAEVHRILAKKDKNISTIIGILVPKEFYATVRHFSF
jgi:Fe-S-cluster-containing hydrogenase component 2